MMKARFDSRISRVLLSTAVACIAMIARCNTSGSLGTTTVSFGSSTIRAIQLGDSTTYNYTRVFADGSKFVGTMVEQVSAYSNSTYGKGLTMSRNFSYDTFASDGTKKSTVIRTETQSLVPVGTATAVTDLVEIGNNGTLAQVTFPAAGVVLPFLDGTLQTGQMYSYPYSLSDGTMVTASSTVMNADTVTVPYGTVATLKVTSSETNTTPTGTTTFSRTVFRHAALGVVKRTVNIVVTPLSGNGSSSQETFELVSTNIPAS